MKSLLATGIACTLTLVVSACAPIEPIEDQDIVLVRAKTISAQVVECPPPPKDGREYVMVDACWKLTLRPEQTLIGTTDQDAIVIGRFGATLTPGVEFFVLERHVTGGYDVVDWKYAVDGPCFGDEPEKELSPDEARKIRLSCERLPGRPPAHAPRN